VTCCLSGSIPAALISAIRPGKALLSLASSLSTESGERDAGRHCCRNEGLNVVAACGLDRQTSRGPHIIASDVNLTSSAGDRSVDAADLGIGSDESPGPMRRNQNPAAELMLSHQNACEMTRILHTYWITSAAFLTFR
jgi:hypothetical protein